MEIDIRDKEIINQTANFVRTYHSKQSKLPVVPGPDEEGLTLLLRVYTIAKKYRQQEKENHYKDEYGASTWRGDFEFYRNIHFVLTWCDKFSVFIDENIEAPAKQKNTASSRPGVTVKDFMLIDSDDEKERLLKTLHTLIDGEQGKGTALAVLVCMELGLMRKPAFSVMLAEFPGIGSRQGFNKHFYKGYSAYLQQEIDCIKAHLVGFQSSI